MRPPVKVRRIMLQHLAATMVQRRYRVYLARKRVNKEIEVRKEIRLNRFAIPIQGQSAIRTVDGAC